jgi:predicted dehydrogenase
MGISANMSSKSSDPLRVGLIGCGAISNAYFEHLAPFSRYAKITACSDLDLERARATAAHHHLPKSCTVEELLADPDIDVILNLTIPAAHASVNLAALRAGKHAYCEKPFALNYQEGLEVVREAAKRKLYVGCAPDTVLGGGIQTCRNVIDQGLIGRPVAGVANMLCPGHESWHPRPEFFYQKGGGPLFDMGPYYLTSLVLMLGPVKSLVAMAKVTRRSRTITSQPSAGKIIEVEVPTHLAAELEFANGALVSVQMSFDVWQHHLPLLEIYGSEGSLSCPDPNCFNGEVDLWTPATKQWQKVPLTHNDQTGRGIGIAEMALAIHEGRMPRMNGELALHVVEIMEAIHVSADSGRKVGLESTCSQPQPLPAGLKLGHLEKNG